MKTIAGITFVIAAIVFLSFGTLSPCGILRENVRKQDGLARILPDALIDAAIESKFGSLSPARCIGLLVSNQQPPVAAPTVAAQPPSQPQQAARIPQGNSDALEFAKNETIVAINECRAKRLSGELRSYVASAQCSNPRIVKAFANANYRHMDLIAQLTAKRTLIAEQLDRNQITEANADIANKNIVAEIAEIERRREAGKQ